MRGDNIRVYTIEEEQNTNKPPPIPPPIVKKCYFGGMKANLYFKDKNRAESLILLYVAFDNKRIKISTGISCQTKDWNHSTQRINEPTNLSKGVSFIDLPEHEQTKRKFIFNTNKKLNDFVTKANEVFQNLVVENNYTNPTHEQFKKRYLDELHGVKDTKPSTLFEYWETFLHNAPTQDAQNTIGNRPIQKGTLKTYASSLQLLKLFKEKKRFDISFESLDKRFHTQFLSFMNEFKFSQDEKGKQIKLIKAICNRALSDGYAVNPFVFTKGFYKPSEDSKEKVVYLEFEEITRIIELELKGMLSNARDWFVIGLNTGLRVSDLLKLNEANISGENLIVTTQKTKTPIAIPIMTQVDEVIKRRNGFPRKISDQKFNEYIKEVCCLAQIDAPTKGAKITRVIDTLKRRKHGYTTRKIDGTYPKYELVSSHTCRRSFASNYYGKIPTAIIRAITGHSSEREFLKYIQVSPEEHARNFMEHVKKGIV